MLIYIIVLLHMYLIYLFNIAYNFIRKEFVLEDFKVPVARTSLIFFFFYLAFLQSLNFITDISC
jgi:hypothetical protein